MRIFQKEVQTFIHLSETLLSRVGLNSELDDDERGLVAIYAQTLVQRYLVSQYGWDNDTSVDPLKTAPHLRLV